MNRARLALAGLVVAGRARRLQDAGGAAPARALGERRRPGARRGGAAHPRTNQVVIDRVVAVVNGDVIMMSELQEAIAPLPPRRPERARRRRGSSGRC